MYFNLEVDDFVNNLVYYVIVDIDGPNNLRGLLHVECIRASAFCVIIECIDAPSRKPSVHMDLVS